MLNVPISLFLADGALQPENRQNWSLKIEAVVVCLITLHVLNLLNFFSYDANESTTADQLMADIKEVKP